MIFREGLFKKPIESGKKILQEQAREFKKYLQESLGLGKPKRPRTEFEKRLVAAFENGLAAAEKTEDPKERQERLYKTIKENLAQKNILATPEESLRHFEKFFNYSSYMSPENEMAVPGGGTFLDPNDNKIKIYLKPSLDYYQPDYKLAVILEEAIHYAQLKKSGRTRVNASDEIESKDKILKIADYLGFDEERKNFLEQSKQWYKKRESDKKEN